MLSFLLFDIGSGNIKTFLMNYIGEETSKDILKLILVKILQIQNRINNEIEYLNYYKIRLTGTVKESGSGLTVFSHSVRYKVKSCTKNESY